MEHYVTVRPNFSDFIVSFKNDHWCIKITKDTDSEHWRKLLSKIETGEKIAISISGGEDSYWFLHTKNGKIVMDININNDGANYFFSRNYEYSDMIPVFRTIIVELEKYEDNLKYLV